MPFDPIEFEALSGINAANYAIRVAQEGALEEERILPYFREKAATMDLPHLELAVHLLGELGTDAALQMVASYLNHPNFNVRFVANKIIAHLPTVDERIMKSVVETLSSRADDVWVSELKHVLGRPANAKAQRIAQEYRSATRP